MGTDSFASLMQTPNSAGRASRRLTPGEVLEVAVIQVGDEFVYVDVGTPSDGRIPRIEFADSAGDVAVKVGERIRVRVVEARSDGPLLQVMASQPGALPVDGPKPDEVLKAKITRVERFGVFITTPKGDGLVPLRELVLPPGSDHRKLFSVGRELDVVVVDANAQGKLRFSASRVARVVEEQNFRDFSRSASAAAATAAAATPAAKAEPEPKHDFGSLGDLLREKLKQPALAAVVKSGAPAPTGTAARSNSAPTGPSAQSGSVKRESPAAQPPAPAASRVAPTSSAEPPAKQPGTGHLPQTNVGSRSDVVKRRR
jgi:predicted RNA-binding protein with RPS1 domain